MRCLHKSCSVFRALSNGIHIVRHNSQNWKFAIWVRQLWQRQYPNGPPIFDQIFCLKHLKFDRKYFKSDSTWCPLRKLSSTADFLQKMSGCVTPIFTLGSPPTLSRWFHPYKLYTRRNAIVHRWSSFLNFSKIFYSKKVFFVSPEGCQIVKMLNFDPHLAPPTFGGGTWSPHFCD